MARETLYQDRAALYDRIYHWKDYATESEKLRGVLAAEGVPEGARILEAACGTGSHLAHLRTSYDVAGFDKSEAMVAIAREKLPEVSLGVADMTSFELARPVRAILCLFSSIAYLLTDAELAAAARRFAAALEPGGVLVVEPWLAPEDCVPGHASMHTYDAPELKLARSCVVEVEGDLTILDMHWLVTERDRGVTYFVERHELRLMPRARLVEVFARAGFDARFEPDGLMPKRGLLIARRR